VEAFTPHAIAGEPAKKEITRKAIAIAHKILFMTHLKLSPQSGKDDIGGDNPLVLGGIISPLTITVKLPLNST
jgi:hypothetical protein